MAQASVRMDAIDKAAVKALLSNVRNGYPKAMTRAINAGLSSARIEARREVQKQVTAKTKYVNAAFSEDKANYGNISGSLVSTGRPLPMIAYSVRQINKGASVQINKNGDRKLIEGAFISTMKSGHEGVFVRTSKIKGTGKWPVGKKMKFKPKDKFRLPTKELFGPSIPAIFERGPILDLVEATGTKKFQDELLRQTDMLLK